MSSNPQNLPKKNHYVPQFYLKGFSQDEENIYRLSKETGEIKQLPIKVIAFQKNLYTYKTKDGSKESLEDMFSQIEGLAASAIEKLKKGDVLSDQEKADLSIFLSSQMVRTPAAQNHLLGAQKELTEKMMRMRARMLTPQYVQTTLKKKGKNITMEEAEDIVDFGTNEKRSEVKVDIPQGYWIKQMLSLAMDLCPVFQICDWEIKHSETKYGFLTSDHPFMLIPGEKPDFFGVGLLTPKAKKIIPLASDICLIAHEPSKDPVMAHSFADKETVRKINRWSVKNSEEYVFSPAEGKVEKIIKQDKSLLSVPKRYSVS